jgi:hypothetical protein
LFRIISFVPHEPVKCSFGLLHWPFDHKGTSLLV